VLCEVSDLDAVLCAPFLDRSLRKLAKPGGAAFIATRDAVEGTIPTLVPDVPEWNVLWIWNTGRCGSTLVHRALAATGCVVSLSEPMWMDQVRVRSATALPEVQVWACGQGRRGHQEKVRCAYAVRWRFPPLRWRVTSCVRVPF
jgi:hypothetical protein